MHRLADACTLYIVQCSSLSKIVLVYSTAILRSFFWDHPDEPVSEGNFWTSWCKGRLTEADTQTVRLGTTPSGLSSAYLHHPPVFIGRMPFLPPNQQCQSTELLLYNGCQIVVVLCIYEAYVIVE